MSVALCKKGCLLAATLHIYQAAALSQPSAVSLAHKMKSHGVHMRRHLDSSAPADDGRLALEVKSSAELISKAGPARHHGHARHHGQHRHGPSWSYGTPDDWANDYTVCAGSGQSPIELQDSNRTVLGVLGTDRLIDRVSYIPLRNLKIKNNGHNEQVDVPTMGTFNLPDGRYDLKQFHFHFPSEHMINGRNAAGEIHMVHQKSTDPSKIAVIGLFLESDPNFLGGDLPEGQARKSEIDFMNNLGFGDVTTLPEEEDEVDLANTGSASSVDIMAFRNEFAGDYFHYIGSFTTPPCTEGVHWYVMKRPAAVTQAMVDNFKARFPAPANNRPVQDLNGRKIVVDKTSV